MEPRPETLDGENETLRKYLPDVAPENYSKLKLTRAQLKSIGIKRKEPPSEKQKLRNEAAANRFREMHKKTKADKLAGEQQRTQAFEQQAKVKIAEKERKPYTKKPKVKLAACEARPAAPIPPEPDSETETSEEEQYVTKKAKKASKTAAAIAKLDERMSRVAQPYVNPYYAAMMNR
jgi:hypothetical protein